MNALEALRKSSFDFYSVRDKHIPASYDGIIFHDVVNSATASTSPSLEEVHQGATARLLQAMACMHAFSADGRILIIQEAMQHLIAYQNALFCPSSVLAQWEPLYLLALFRISRCAEAAKYPLHPEIPNVCGNLAAQSELLSIVQHATKGWVNDQDLRVIASIAATAANPTSTVAGASPMRDRSASDRAATSARKEEKVAAERAAKKDELTGVRRSGVQS